MANTQHKDMGVAEPGGKRNNSRSRAGACSRRKDKKTGVAQSKGLRRA